MIFLQLHHAYLSFCGIPFNSVYSLLTFCFNHSSIDNADMYTNGLSSFNSPRAKIRNRRMPNGIYGGVRGR